jgi:membrane-bound lytic murein transglycosylase F
MESRGIKLNGSGFYRFLLLLALLPVLGGILLPGCSDPVSEPAEPVFRETGDLAALQARKYLRILTPWQDLVSLERRGLSVQRDLDLARELAGTLGLTPMIVRIRDRREMMAALDDGRGDLIIARLAATRSRKERFAFSVPTDHVREMLVIRKGETPILDLQDLDGLQVTVRASSSFHETLLKIQQDVPGLVILNAEENMDTEELMYGVQNGSLQATVADDDLIREAMGYLHNIQGDFPLTRARPIGWALRKGNPELRKKVDAFLHERALAGDSNGLVTGDLPVIRERRVLRVLTRNTPASYFLHRGEQMGFEFELVRKFAESQGLRLQIVVPDKGDQLIPWLLEGRGDLIAAMMTVTENRAAQVQFSRPYNQVSQVVVSRQDEPAMTGPQDLAGRTLAVRKSSAYMETLQQLAETVDFEIAEVAEDLETATLIRGVGAGTWDLTVADRSILDIELAYRDDIQAALQVGPETSLAWAVRPGNQELLQQVNLFLNEQYRGKFFNVLMEKYFTNKRHIGKIVQDNNRSGASLSPYDDLFRKYGSQVNIDWRLLAAQGYQESRFNPTATSWAGAVGVMQIMPLAAEEVGVTGDLQDPEVGIEAGALYMRWLLDRFKDGPQDYGEQLRFALGAYNAGRGHVLDGRRVAETIGKNPDQWFGNVEEAMVLLRKPEYASKSRFGYCRGDQPKRYVREITDRYLSYAQLTH